MKRINLLLSILLLTAATAQAEVKSIDITVFGMD
jgi:hypothetical protein